MSLTLARPVGFNQAPTVLGKHGWESSQYYAALVDNAYTPVLTHTTRADILANLTASQTLVALASKIATYSNPNNYLDCAHITFIGNLLAKYCVLLQGDASTPQASDLLFCYIDLNNGISANTTVDASIVLSTLGLINITVTPAS